MTFVWTNKKIIKAKSVQKDKFITSTVNLPLKKSGLGRANKTLPEVKKSWMASVDGAFHLGIEPRSFERKSNACTNYASENTKYPLNKASRTTHANVASYSSHITGLNMQHGLSGSSVLKQRAQSYIKSLHSCIQTHIHAHMVTFTIVQPVNGRKKG